MTMKARSKKLRIVYVNSCWIIFHNLINIDKKQFSFFDRSENEETNLISWMNSLKKF